MKDETAAKLLHACRVVWAGVSDDLRNTCGAHNPNTIFNIPMLAKGIVTLREAIEEAERSKP